MQLIYHGLNNLNDNVIIQSFLLFWSFYGIYLSIVENDSFNKKIFYQISQKNKYTKILFWYKGDHHYYFTNPLKYTISLNTESDNIEINSNCQLESCIFKDNKIIISKKDITTNDSIEINLYGKNKRADASLEIDDLQIFDFVCHRRKSYILYLCIFSLLAFLFFNNLSLFIDSFTNIKWNNYYALEEQLKEYGIGLSYDFQVQYENIYNNFSNPDTRDFEIAVAIMDQYGQQVPLITFYNIEKETLLRRIKYIIECICPIIIMIFWINQYYSSLPYIKDKPIVKKYKITFKK